MIYRGVSSLLNLWTLNLIKKTILSVTFLLLHYHYYHYLLFIITISFVVLLFWPSPPLVFVVVSE